MLSRTGLLLSQGIVSPGGAAPPGLLDIFPGAVCAYSYRKLRTAYAGSAIQARRVVDSVTADQGFLPNGDLDIPTYHTFIGAGNAQMSIWYDQSGNAADQVQATLNSQPGIHAPEYPANNITGAVGDQSQQWNMTTPDVANVQNIWATGGFLAFVFNVSSGPTNTIISKGTNPNGWLVFLYLNGAIYQVVLYWAAPTTAATSWASNAVSNTPVRHVVTIAWNSSTPAVAAVITLDGVVCGYNAGTSAPGGALSSEAGPVMIMNDAILNPAPGDKLAGQLYELVAWKTQPPAGVQTTLINNMRSYFGTP
jgi:hypothetical protein